MTEACHYSKFPELNHFDGKGETRLRYLLSPGHVLEQNETKASPKGFCKL